MSDCLEGENSNEIMQLPYERKPGADKVSKIILQDTRVINALAKAIFPGTEDGCYVSSSTKICDGKSCDVLLTPHDPLSTLPPIIVEVQGQMNEVFLARTIHHSTFIYKKYKRKPVVVIFGVNRASPYFRDTMVVDNEFSFARRIDCTGWAKRCIVLNASTVNVQDGQLQPLQALGYFFCSQATSINSLKHGTSDPLIKLSYSIALERFGCKIVKKNSKKDKGNETKGGEVKVDEAKVDEVKNDEVKNDEVKDDEVKDNEVKDDEVKDNEVKCGEVKDNEVKDDEVKDNEVKCGEVKDNEVKCGEIKDNEVKDDEVKNDEVKNDETGDNSAKNVENKESRAKENEEQKITLPSVKLRKNKKQAKYKKPLTKEQEAELLAYIERFKGETGRINWTKCHQEGSDEKMDIILRFCDNKSLKTHYYNYTKTKKNNFQEITV